MGLCDFIATYGAFPRDCSSQQQWMLDLINAHDDHYRCCGGATSNPTDAQLDACYAPCTVPDTAIITWVDTTDPVNPVASTWVRCGTSTQNDTDGDGITDRDWLSLTSKCTCNTCESLLYPAATVTDTTDTTFNPTLYVPEAHAFSCTSTGGPLVMTCESYASILWDFNDARTAFSWVSAYLYRDGALVNVNAATDIPGQSFSNTRGYVQTNATTPNYNHVGSFQLTDLTPAVAATYSWELRHTLYKGTGTNVTPNNSGLRFPDNAATRWVAYELCCT